MCLGQASDASPNRHAHSATPALPSIGSGLLSACPCHEGAAHMISKLLMALHAGGSVPVRPFPESLLQGRAGSSDANVSSTIPPCSSTK
jgi:hypothetical protein